MRKFLWLLMFLTGTPAVLIWWFVLLKYSHSSPASTSISPQVLGLSTQLTAANQFSIPEITTSINSSDSRFYIVKNYLHQYNSPLETYSRLIIDTSEKYSLDYRLLVAIAQQESNLCKKIPENSYNCWGFGIYGDIVTRFNNYPQAIDTVARALKRDYLDQGLKTPDEIMAKYTPPSLKIGGPWAKGVNQFLAELE